MSRQRNLFLRHLQNLPPGRLTWIGLRPERRHPLIEVSCVIALQGLGLEGDHRCDKTPGSGRQVTIISQEYIQQIEHFSRCDSINPGILRRNLVVEGINLTALRHQQFYIGEALFEATALCHPCSRMEQALGPGGVAAMLGHGGLCAKILQTGEIRIGSEVIVKTD